MPTQPATSVRTVESVQLAMARRQCPVLVERGQEHVGREHAPQEQIPAQEILVGLTELDDGDQRQPEESVAGEGRQPERIPLPELHDPGDDLREPAVEQPHREDGVIEREEAGVVEIEQHRRHPETHQAERCRVCTYGIQLIPLDDWQSHDTASRLELAR